MGQWAYDSLDPIFLLLRWAILSSFSYFTYETEERKNKTEESNHETLSPFIIRYFSYFTYETEERKNETEEPKHGTLSPFIIR
jgi:hypothetical protein